MRDFNLYVDITNTGKLSESQLDQARALIDTLPNRRINVYWIIAGERINTHQIINIVRNVHTLCKKKGVIIHNEICISNRTMSPLARLSLKYTQISTYYDKRNATGDFASLCYQNQPTGCIFNSCLGNTLYLKQSGKISLCPHAEGIVLKPISLGEPSNAIFDTEDFKALLLHQIQKRARCKKECRLFNLCHGGCPIQEDKEKCSILMHVEQQNLTAEMRLEQEIRQLSELYRG